MSFDTLGLIAPILNALTAEGYSQPTAIQKQAIPVILSEKDLFGIAQTGTGKTAAFSIPVLQLLANQADQKFNNKAIEALILTPTRELAIQIGESIGAYGQNLPIRHTVIFGGVDQKPQVREIQAGVDILVATPGRLLDLIVQRHISLKHIKYFVLDEADRMLDMGFIHDIRRVIGFLPAKRQSLFFSATMPPDILKLAGTILKNPVKVEVTPTSSTAEKIAQQVYYVDKTNKRKLLVHLLQDQTIKSALVFTRTKHGADRVAKDLVKNGIGALAIHGDKSQGARQNALSTFKDGRTRVLVATDIAARGIDVEELTHVINFEVPNQPETYVHRIGRTGRAGASGIAITLCDQEEKAYLKDISYLIKKQIPVVQGHPFPMEGINASEQKPAQPKSASKGKTDQPKLKADGTPQKKDWRHSKKNKSGKRN